MQPGSEHFARTAVLGKLPKSSAGASSTRGAPSIPHAHAHFTKKISTINFVYMSQCARESYKISYNNNYYNIWISHHIHEKFQPVSKEPPSLEDYWTDVSQVHLLKYT